MYLNRITVAVALYTNAIAHLVNDSGTLGVFAVGVVVMLICLVMLEALAPKM